MSITIDPNNPTANATLTFDDEFNTLSLTNSSGSGGAWATNYYYNTSGDPKAINSLPSNGEQEWYIDNNDPRTAGTTPWTVSNGVLSIKASPTPSNISGAVDNYQYISGELNTHNTFSQQYGLWEMKAQLPAGQGFWPAFWLLPENGQWPPELDIMENLGQDTSSAYTTVHSNTLSNGYEAQKDAVSDTTAWHTYAVDWESDFVTWYIDGKQVDKVATPSDMNLAQYMTLNLAVGGYWPGNADSSTNFNNTYNIDWVKVYQSNAALAAGLTPSGSAAYYGTGNSGGGDTGGNTGGNTGGGSTTPATNPGTSTASTASSHNFLGDGHQGTLIEAANGQLAVGEVSNGQTTYTKIGAIGAEWGLHGSGDFLGAGSDQFLMENTSGAVVVGQVQNGQAHYTTVSGLGSEWTIAGTGSYSGDGKTDYLVHNTNGTLAIGEVSNGQATYTTVGAVGSEWSIKGSGDFLGQGHDQFLMQNTNGTYAIASDQGGKVQYTTVGAVGSEWSVVGTGDYLGGGKTDLLIENSKGQVSVGEVVNGHMTYTNVTALGSNWKFVGSGDYLGNGHDQFEIENAAGQVEVADVSNGQAHFTPVSGLGSTWSFHM